MVFFFVKRNELFPWQMHNLLRQSEEALTPPMRYKYWKCLIGTVVCGSANERKSNSTRLIIKAYYDVPGTFFLGGTGRDGKFSFWGNQIYGLIWGIVWIHVWGRGVLCIVISSLWIHLSRRTNQRGGPLHKKTPPFPLKIQLSLSPRSR